MGWGRRVTAALAAALLAVAVGCGGEADEALEVTSAPSATTAPAPATATVPAVTAPEPVVTGPAVTTGEDVDAARAVLQGYVDAFVAADGATACGLLTDESAEAFLQAVGATVGASSCADAFTAVTEQLPEEQRDAFRGAVIDGLVVTGDTARGRLTVIGVSNEFRLTRVLGDWRIANLPGR